MDEIKDHLWITIKKKHHFFSVRSELCLPLLKVHISVNVNAVEFE